MSSSDLSSDDDDEEPLECDTFDSELLRGPGLRVDLSPSATWTALRFGSVSDTHSSSVSTSSSVSVSPPSEPHSYVKPDASEAETNNDNGQKLQLARQVDVATPRTLKVVCISDTHSLLSRVEIPDGDVLLVAGDMTLRGRHDELVVFDELVGRLPHRHKFCVCGNHEHAHARRHAATKQAMSREKRVARPDDVIRNCRMLRDELVVVDGVMRLWGSGWKSNVRPPADGAHSAVDVLLTHAPPRAYDPNMSSCEEQVIRLCCSAASPSTPSASASASTSTSAPPPEPALESPVINWWNATTTRAQTTTTTTTTPTATTTPADTTT
ncbi:hypothetical protein Pelo_11091 [Pelomyxa schiedti]|nr:hypothetical protein Pelo_11091 [Pelomyxa schiedti]